MWTRTDNVTINTGFSTTAKVTLCFRPKALILWGWINGFAGLDMRFSFCSTSTDEIEKIFRVDFFSSTYVNSVNAALANGLSLNSFLADGFVLNFPAFGTYGVSYTAIGGDDLVAKVGSFTTTAGSAADIVVTGLGFRPDFLLTQVGHYNGGSGSLGCIGMASGPTAQGSVGFYRALFGAMQKSFSTTVLDSMATGTVFLRSFDSDGFTIGNTGAPGVSQTIYYLALHDPTAAFQVGSDSQKTSTGTKATTGVGFKPGAGLFVSGGRTAVGTDSGTDPTALVFSAVDGARENALGAYSYAGGGDHAYSDANLLPFSASSASLLASSHLSSFDSDGFTLNWTTADAIARKFLYAMFQTKRPDNDPCRSVYIPQIYRVKRP